MTQQESVPLMTQYLQLGGKYYIPANTSKSKHNKNHKQQRGEGIQSEWTQMLVKLSLHKKKNPEVVMHPDAKL